MEIIREGILDVQVALHETKKVCYISLLQKNKLLVLRYDIARTTFNCREENSITGSLKLHTELLPDMTLLCHVLSKLDTTLKMTLIIFPSYFEPQNVLNYSNTIALFSTVKDAQILPGFRYRNVTALAGSEDSLTPYAITVRLLSEGSVLTGEFVSKEQTAKTLQIWSSENPLISCSEGLCNEAQEHLAAIGVAVEESKEMMLESVLRNGNYQIVKEAIVRRGIDGLESFKFVADYLSEKFEAIRTKLSLSVMGQNVFIEQFLDLLQPSINYNPKYVPPHSSELKKDVKFIKLTLTDCKSELRGYISIFNAIKRRLETGSEVIRDCLGLLFFRERDQSSIEYVNAKTLLFEKYETILQLLLWTLDRPELIRLDLETLHNLFSSRAKTRRLILNDSKLFSEMIFEEISDETMTDAPLYPLAIKQLIQLSLRTRHTEAVHYMFLYTLFDACGNNAEHKELVDSYIHVYHSFSSRSCKYLQRYGAGFMDYGN
eukprot:TRINITY_DN1468_c0_g1_i1.p1 TRINITY_DN1468_c0_g1~~TRINITY_DN1468_c0_g1_i1.p1  ORF type:complete len:489 (-),score=101.85 TRINITY_DN1468_c0_g1_i1:985-2451(-)